MTIKEKSEFEACLSGILNQSDDELLRMMEEAGSGVYKKEHVSFGGGGGSETSRRHSESGNEKVSDGGPLTHESKQSANPPFAAPLG